MKTGAREINTKWGEEETQKEKRLWKIECTDWEKEEWKRRRKREGRIGRKEKGKKV